MSQLSPEMLRYLDVLRHERQLSSHTLDGYERDLAKLAALIAQESGALSASGMEHHHARRFAARLHAQGLAARSIARTLSSWRGFFAWMCLDGAISGNPLQDVHAPKAGKRLPKALSPELATQLVSSGFADSVDGLRDRAIFEVFYSSGLRLSELVGLDLRYREEQSYRSAGWIDLAEAQLTVTGKGKKRRVVPLGRFAIEALQAWLSGRATLIKVDQDALFVSSRGTRLSARTIQNRLKIHGQRLGLPTNVHPHVLRHSFASHLLQSSGDLRAVQELLGHSSIASTQVYTSLDFQRLAAVYDQAHPRARKNPAR